MISLSENDGMAAGSAEICLFGHKYGMSIGDTKCIGVYTKCIAGRRNSDDLLSGVTGGFYLHG